MSKFDSVGYSDVKAIAAGMGEHNDCAVRAVSLVTGVHYVDVHGIMQGLGRKHRGGTKSSVTYGALGRLGFGYERVKYVSARTIRGLSSELDHLHGKYLVWTSGHILAVVNGVIHDWTDGRLHRIKRIERVIGVHGNS